MDGSFQEPLAKGRRLQVGAYPSGSLQVQGAVLVRFRCLQRALRLSSPTLLRPATSAAPATAGGAMFEIRKDDLSSVETRALLALHLAGMHANSPPESVFSLDLSGLQAPEVTVWTAWRDGRAASVGALKMLGDGAAEVKSMRTHPDLCHCRMCQRPSGPSTARSYQLPVSADTRRPKVLSQLQPGPERVLRALRHSADLRTGLGYSKRR